MKLDSISLLEIVTSLNESKRSFAKRILTLLRSITNIIIQPSRLILQFLMSYKTNHETKPTFGDILNKAAKSGLAGASAMTIQVSLLMWMRTTMNYQFKNGGKFIPTLKKLYQEGGIIRFYRGTAPALIIGPLSRFGDTAANMFATTLCEGDSLKSLPIFIQTSLGSVMAGIWRLNTLPVDAWKTSKQVYGKEGLNILRTKYQAMGLSAFYQGGIASALATMAGHYPWFVTNNYLQYYLPRYDYKTEMGSALLRSAGIGFACTLISDTLSNSIRVLKTVKQTSAKQISYNDAIIQITKTDGIRGLLFRGLQTKLLTNAVQGVCFNVAWKYITYLMNQKEKLN